MIWGKNLEHEPLGEQIYVCFPLKFFLSFSAFPWVEKVIISWRPAKKMKIQLINKKKSTKAIFGFVVKTSFSLDLLFDGEPSY